jgi:hypothetical protein
MGDPVTSVGTSTRQQAGLMTDCRATRCVVVNGAPPSYASSVDSLISIVTAALLPQSACFQHGLGDRGGNQPDRVTRGTVGRTSPGQRPCGHGMIQT